MAGAWLQIIDTSNDHHTMFWDEHFDGNGVYQWTDGNYGCDCNRALFFERAAGVKFEEKIECSAEKGRFHVPFAFTADGKIVVIDGLRD